MDDNDLLDSAFLQLDDKEAREDIDRRARRNRRNNRNRPRGILLLAIYLPAKTHKSRDHRRFKVRNCHDVLLPRPGSIDPDIISFQYTTTARTGDASAPIILTGRL